MFRGSFSEPTLPLFFMAAAFDFALPEGFCKVGRFGYFRPDNRTAI